jgi:MGT family glycosyltransferase
VCTDNVTGYPAIELTGGPWVRFVSANPLEMRDSYLPPVLSGLPVADRSQWDAFRAEYHRRHEALLAEHNDFRRSVGVPACPLDEFNTNSPWANLYLFPEVADYSRSTPLDATWTRLNSTVRTTEAAFDVYEHVPGDGKVVYLSLGSLGCMDVGLMQRLIDAMAKTEHRVIVSMGPLKDQMKLGPNMYGDQFLPQPSILPQCDLLITHGGNNTVCEGFHFGLPMIALPLFWDQYDNAQRVQEVGCGVRLDTYRFEDRELTSSIDDLLANTDLRRRMERHSEEIRKADGKTKAADLIEGVARKGPSD